MHGTYKVTAMRQEIAVGLDGKPADAIRVEFTVDGQGPFVERFPKEGFDPANVKLMLGDFARKIATLREE